MSAHAVLSPSSAGRWLVCTPSARLEQKFPDQSGEAALEGVLAHALAELMLRTRSSEQPDIYSDEIAAIKQHARYSEDMLFHVDSYTTFVENQLQEARETTPDAVLLIEQLLDLQSWVPDGFGTADAVIIADGLMEIIDLKFGKGVPVSATSNKQMMLYALGAIHKFGIVYDIHTVRMTIFQPRLDNVSTFEMSADALQHWADISLAPLARLAFAGEGDFIPGDHCRFCKARAQCKAFADQNLVLAKHDFKDQTLLSDSQISSILLLADQFKRWLSDLEEFALNAAVSSGKQWPGLKLVEGRSIRTWTSQDEVARTLIQAGIPEAIIYERKLLGLTAMEKVLSKKTFNDLLSGLIIKPQGKPALVPLNDKRNELNSASKDFAL
jgi:hypothetical protein